MKTAISIWEEESFLAPQDILIVGAGFVGAWSALELIIRNPNSRVTILDRGIIPLGASTRNAGFACFGSPTEIIDDAKKMGDDKMWSTVEMRYKGIQKIRQYFKDDEIGFDHCGGYECFMDDKDILREVDSKIDWLNDGMKEITGASNSFSWCNNKLTEFGLKGFSAMIENKLEGGLHSGRLLLALLRKVQSLGVNILTGVEVKGWEKHGDYVEVFTPSVTFKTSQLLICTNALNIQLTKQTMMEPARGQVLVTEPIKGLKMKGTFHYDEGFYYFRNVGDRVLIGGARNKDFASEQTNAFELNDTIQAELERFVAQHILPQTNFSITHRWSGIMGFTNTKMPCITKVEEQVFTAVACNGMGVALSPIIAEQICDMMS